MLPAAAPLTPELLSVFAVLPGAHLLLSPALHILAASDEYLVATLTQRPTLVGQYLFDAFPENPQDPEARALPNLRASLLQVLTTGQPHVMAPQPFDVPDPAHPGQFVERHWLPRNTPVLDEGGQVQALLHTVQDITATRLAQQQLRESEVREHGAYVEVTDALQATQHQREQVQHHNEELAVLNEELTVLNEELQAANEDLLASNTALSEAQQQLQQLNQELEARVAERTRAALALQADLLAAAQRQAQQQALFYQVFEETPAAICIQRGPEHRYEYANAAYQAFFPGRQLLGRRVADALPETVESGVVGLLDRVYETGETYYGEELPLLVAQPGGRGPQQMYFTFTYQALREQGAIVGISTFAYNVAPQVLARQQREAERQRLLHLFREAPAAICILAGPDLVFEFVNPGYEQLLPGRALPGRPIFEVLPELVGTPVQELLRQVYATGQTREERGLRVPLARPADGVLEDRYFTFVYQGRRDEQGHVTGVLVFAFEVTEQVEARQAAEASAQQAQALARELVTANEQLRRTNVDLDNFIYAASHDLKAPISNIEGLLQLLRADLPVEVAQRADVEPTLGLMGESVERFKRTIEHLTEVSKLQKEHEATPTLVDLKAIIEDVRRDLQPLLEETGAQLVLDVGAFPPVQFSEKNLRSVVYNLLSNALKYRSPDRPPHVDVRAHVKPGHTVLEVHDNGLGIAAHHLPQLFTMFQRFHDHVEGTGIGLYMVKKMVENAGGKLEVHSQVGAGTTFFVYLPHSCA
ncbi:PAS domain-containing protein [Hymenobacter sp. HD11105]